MKVLFFNSSVNWGGGEKWHHEMSLSMLQKGVDAVVCANQKSLLYKKSNDSGIKTYPVNINNISYLNLFLLLKIGRLIKKIQPDIIVLNLPIDVKTAGIMAHFMGVKHIIYRRGSAIPIKKSLSNLFLFKKIITRLLVNSEETMKTALQKNPQLFDTNKIKIIYNGIDAQSLLANQTYFAKNREQDSFIIGHLARLSKQKGQIYLIDLALQLKSEGYTFKILIGGNGELENDLKQLVISKGLSDVVEFIGFVDNPMNFLQQIDVFVFPSLWEGFGYSIIEAKLARKPVIAFDVSSNPEVIRHEIDGILVPAFDPQKLFDAVVMFINNKELVQKMGQNGYDDVMERFTIDRAANQLFDYFQQIISN